MNWYVNAKTEQMKREALDWQGIKNGLLAGMGIGAIPAAIMIWMATTGVTQQEARLHVGQDEAKAQQIIETAPQEVIQELQLNLQNPSGYQTPRDTQAKDPFASQLSKAPQPQDQLESVSPSSVRQNPFGHFITQWEGTEERVYTDTKGNRTIGVGFNLEMSDARETLASVGADYDAIMAGNQSLNSQQIQTILGRHTEEAEKGARSIFPNFDRHPFPAQQILVDLVFNMGYSKMASTFPKFKVAMAQGDYRTAAAELVDSKWFGQVGRRSRHHVGVLEQLAH